jgi:hypothetical protein
MTYIQLIVQTVPQPGNEWRATAHRTDSAMHRKEYRGAGANEYTAAEDAVSQLMRDCMRTA